MPDIGEDEDAALEPGWRALEAGDVATARRLAGEAGEDDPEALLLLAACCREEDDVEPAVALLRRAIAADGEWPTPELWLAELLAADPDALEEALRHAARALDLADDEGEYLSALALKAGLEAELGRPEAAKRTLADLPPGDVALGDADLALEIADLHLALGDPALARARLRTLTAVDPSSADAWHALGCAAAELDDDVEMRAAWKRVWALDAAPAAAGGDGEGDGDLGAGGRLASRALADGEVAAIAEAALGELPPRARELLRGVPILIAELPAEADVEAGLDPRALGLFSGTAYPEQSHLGGQPGLTQIVLFRRNLERVGGDDEELREEVRITMLHETGHFFGMDDEELDGAGLG
jgi:predicted Zn-dependent protease with MMP-like domain/Flp pilus assembly protein TadD